MTASGSATSRELGRPHPEERACGSAAANQVACARVSKDEDVALMFRDGEEPRGRHALSRLILRSARGQEVPQSSNGRARVSKDGAATPLMLRDGARARASSAWGRRARRTGRAWRNAFTIARAGRRAKQGLWLFPVFVLFRPVIGGEASRPKKRRRRAFPLLMRWL